MSDEPNPLTLDEQVYGESGVPPKEAILASAMALHQCVVESAARVEETLRGIGMEWHHDTVEVITRTMQELGTDEPTSS